MKMAEATKHLHKLMKNLEVAEAKMVARQAPVVPRSARAFDLKTIAALKAYTGGLPAAAPRMPTKSDSTRQCPEPDAYLAGIEAKQESRG